MIYLDDHIWDFDLQRELEAVGQQRREYALRYRHERDQRLSIVAYRLLQQALQQEYGITELPPFSYDNNGKPSLEGLPSIYFSLSHCSEAAACAVSDCPVGIDIETFDHYSEEVTARVMSDDEMRQILSSPAPAVAFTRLWTRKESLYKLSGRFTDDDVPHMLAHAGGYDFTTLIFPKYALTLCRESDFSSKN